jgi:hypothetical protein
MSEFGGKDDREVLFTENFEKNEKPIKESSKQKRIAPYRGAMDISFSSSSSDYYYDTNKSGDHNT